MSVSVQSEPVSTKDLENKILVLGVGGAGCNSVNRMHAMGLQGAELVAINTDKQHLSTIDDDIAKILIGKAVTQGFGAGGHAEVGAKSLEYSRRLIEDLLYDSKLVFIIAGMGGGTGTGAAPLIADIAHKAGALSIGIVTFPFDLERLKQAKAEDGIVSISQVADSTIVIDNNRLLELVPNLPVNEAFKVADELICRTVRGITETLTRPSLINLDFADVKAVTANKGISTIAVGESDSTSNRGESAVKDALSNALLDVDPFGAKGCLIHITGGEDLTLGEANAIGEQITHTIDPNATVIWGARVDPSFQGRVEVVCVFTGLVSPFLGGRVEREANKPSIGGSKYAIRGMDGKIKKGIIEF